MKPEITFWSDWDSFMFWKPKNWRDFTIINISGEVSEHKNYEIHIALLGVHCYVQKFKEFDND